MNFAPEFNRVAGLSSCGPVLCGNAGGSREVDSAMQKLDRVAERWYGGKNSARRK